MDPSIISGNDPTNSTPNTNNPASDGPELWTQGYDHAEEKGFFDNLAAHFIDFIQTFVVFAAIFALIYLFAAQPHKVSGNSMFPTFHNGDYILTDKITYRLGYPKIDDVIVFKNPRNEAEDYIKRVIALPGDTVRVENEKVYVNDQLLNEYYLPLNTPTNTGNYLTEGSTAKVAEGTIIVFGDNRGHSSDSREWGPLPKEKIIGRVFFRYWPPQVFGFFKALP